MYPSSNTWSNLVCFLRYSIGVHYDDLLVETPDVQVAVSRLSAEEQVAR